MYRSSEVDTASGTLDADSADGAPADVLDGRDRHPLLVVVDGLHDAADGAALDGNGEHGLALDAHDVAAVGDPVVGGVGEDDGEAEEGDDVGDAGVGGVSDGGLDGREDCCARDTHDEDTGTAACVRAKVGSSESEEGRVHRRHEEENDDEHRNTGNALDGADDCGADDGADGVEDEEEVGLEDRRKSSGNETTDGEGDQGVGQHLRALRVADTTVLVCIVDE